MRSDEQLVELFRAGSEEAFRAIHDRYHKRLFAYARQMLPGRQDAEDALQDVFVRAYSGLRASDRELALRAWLFRIAHNRCVDELRKPSPPPPEVLRLVRTTVHDPLVELDLRESLRRLVEDIRRLPDQQRSALLMRELGGMSYAELSGSLGISVGAVKSLLVRARIALVEAAEARDTACPVIREQLVEAHDHGVRPNANARRHMRDCVGCRSFRRELRGVSRQLAATAPTLGPLGFLAKVLGFSGGAGGGAAGGTGGGAALFGGGGATASAGGLAFGANHVATMLVVAVATAGGAVEIQRTILPQSRPVTVGAARVDRTHLRALPYRGVARDADIHGTPGVVTATGSTAAKPAATRTTAAAKTTKRRHPRHTRGTARLKKVAAQVPAPAAALSGGDLPSSSTTSPPTTTTAGGGLAASCPAAATLNTQSSASGGTSATGSTSESTPTGSPTGSTMSVTTTPCGSNAGSSAQAPAPSNGSSTTAGTTTSSSTGSTSTGSGSTVGTGSGSTPATGSGSTAPTGSASTAETGGSGAAAATGSSSGAGAPSSSSNTTTG